MPGSDRTAVLMACQRHQPTMGIYDRSYYREDVPTFQPWDKYSMVTNLIIVNVALLLLNFIFTNRNDGLSSFLLLRSGDLYQPWNWYRFLTYGFVHGDIFHLLFNMLSLYFLGQSVESRYGRWEFLRFYLITIVLSGLVYCLLRFLPGGGAERIDSVRGASGGVVAIIMLFVYNFPNVTLMIWGILPVKAWVVGVVTVLANLFGFQDYVAYDVHLAGIACATVYFYGKLNFGFLERGLAGTKGVFSSKPKLRVHREEEPSQPSLDEQEADRILAKIHRDGQASLTAKEQKFLEQYSRNVRKKRDRS